MGQYLGLVQLGNTLRSSHQVRDTSNAPKMADANPTYRIYGPNGTLVANGSLLAKDPSGSGGAVTAATNASPIVVTSAGHGLTTGTRVFLQGVGGNSAADGYFDVTVIDASTFSLGGSAGNGAYTSGGTWQVAGLYDINLTPSGAGGYIQGGNYQLLVNCNVGGAAQADLHSFTVV